MTGFVWGWLMGAGSVLIALSEFRRWRRRARRPRTRQLELAIPGFPRDRRWPR